MAMLVNGSLYKGRKEEQTYLLRLVGVDVVDAVEYWQKLLRSPCVCKMKIRSGK